jgi:primosomal protein N' (replication factor Y)
VPELDQREEPAAAPAPAFAEVALPVPLEGALTYRIPPEFAAFVLPGGRVKVPLANRQLVGIVLALHAGLPPGLEGVALKEILEPVDGEPALSASLLELCRFLAEYYLAPLGDAVHFVCPAGLPPVANPLLRLTSLGALAGAQGAEELALQQELLGAGAARWLALKARGLGIPAELLEDWSERGWLALEDSVKRVRYARAYELAPGDFAELLAKAGKSKKGRSVLEQLQEAGHPLTEEELASAAGCGREAIRRLVKLGLLREFTQVERLELGRHRLGGGDASRAIELREDQRQAAGELLQSIDAGEYRGFLLYGMTGSGKTEVYLRAIDRVLEAGRTAIVLVPEIALVPSLASSLFRRYGQRLAILHSNLSQRERLQEWQRIRQGEASLVLGPRSALFAPCRNLGLIVVDEEHDSAYKQGSSPRYQGRDMALLRGSLEAATVVLASATPSLETRHNVELGKLRRLDLTRRAGGAALPQGVLVDLRAEPAARAGEAYFSGRLLMEIRAALEKDDQVILLRNRRGYSPVVMCRACGHKFCCDDCGLTLTLHLRRRVLSCHYCGRQQPMPTACPSCGEAALEAVGAGTERVEERFRELFPGVEVETLDADATQRVGGPAAILGRFGNRQTQVLIGTQMVAKGHHFPGVSLAAVLFADSYLSFPDFRAVERTYSLLAQLAGRSGRGERPGKVLIQTFQPEHYAVRAALEHDDEGFAREELRFRRTFHYPPYSRLIQVLAEDRSSPAAKEAVDALAARVKSDPASREIRCLGPAPAPFERLAGKWRFQFLLRGPSAGRLRRLVQAALKDLPGRQRALLTVDVDPYDLL